MSINPTCITHWYPALLDLGIPTPRTVIVELESGLTEMCYGKQDQATESRIELSIAQITAACDQIGYPCFLRTGLTSGKHDWEKTCHVPNRDSLPKHIYNIVEYSEMVDIVGLPSNVWAARERLPTAPLFTAFYGKMPITREFRLFVRDGKRDHIQAYWPPDSIERPSVGNWEELLYVASHIADGELQYLTAQSERIGERLGGYWSIDWLETKDGQWFCTDLAEGDKSFRWNDNT